MTTDHSIFERAASQRLVVAPDGCWLREDHGRFWPSERPLDAARLGVREVWIFEAGAFRVVTLRPAGYEPIAASEVLPGLDLARLAHHVAEKDQHAALRAFRAELRQA